MMYRPRNCNEPTHEAPKATKRWFDDALKALGEGLSPDLSFQINKYSREEYEAAVRFVETHFTPYRDTRGDSDGDDGA